MVSSVFRQWTVPRNRFLYHWQHHDAAVLALSVVVLTLLIVAAAHICRRAGHGLRTLAKVTVAVLLVDVAIGHVLPVSDMLPGWPQIATTVALLALVGLAGWRWSDQCWRFCERTLLVLSPLFVVLGITAFGWRPIKSGRGSDAQSIRHADKPPIIVLIFDEWSWKHASNGTEFRHELRRARRLSAQATTFPNAKSPGTATFVSVPRILYGSDGYLAKNGDRPLWQSATAVAAAESTWSILSAATAFGYRASSVGFYLPFGELVDSSVGSVWSMTDTPKYNGLGPGMLLTATKAIRRLGDPLSRTVGRAIWFRQWRMWHVRLNRRVESEAVDALRGVGLGDVLWLHFPIPHAPFVFDRRGNVQDASGQGRQERDSLKYLEHLIYADNLLGRLLDVLQEDGMLERSMLVVTSDHGWRTDPGLVEATSYPTVTSVPLIVKWPYQRRPQSVSQSMCLSSLQLLLGPVEAGDTALPSTARLEDVAKGSCDMEARARDSLGWHSTPAMYR